MKHCKFSAGIQLRMGRKGIKPKHKLQHHYPSKARNALLWESSFPSYPHPILQSCSSAKLCSEKQGEEIGKSQAWKLWRRAFERGSYSFSGPHRIRNFHKGERIYDVQPVHRQLLQPGKVWVLFLERGLVALVSDTWAGVMALGDVPAHPGWDDDPGWCPCSPGLGWWPWVVSLLTWGWGDGILSVPCSGRSWPAVPCVGTTFWTISTLCHKLTRVALLLVSPVLHYDRSLPLKLSIANLSRFTVQSRFLNFNSWLLLIFKEHV